MTKRLLMAMAISLAWQASYSQDTAPAPADQAKAATNKASVVASKAEIFKQAAAVLQRHPNMANLPACGPGVGDTCIPVRASAADKIAASPFQADPIKAAAPTAVPGTPGITSTNTADGAVASKEDQDDKDGRPIVKVGKKQATAATPKAVILAVEPAQPVKVLEGTGSSKTKLARELDQSLMNVNTTELSSGFAMPHPDAAVISGSRGATQWQSAVSQVVPEGQRTPPPSGGYPGLGSPTPGIAQAAKPVAVQAQNGVNEMVVVSSFMPNRIATPFIDAQVIDFSKTDFKVVGGDVYLVPKTKEPIGLFIRDNKPGSQTIALTLVPKQVPGVSVLISLDNGYSPSGQKSAAEATEDPREEASYEANIKKVLRKVSMEGTPSGYTETGLVTGIALLGDIRIVPEKQYSGQNFNIFRYRLINNGKGSLELSEETFYQKGVKAVAFYPLLRLDAWQSTKVFIVTGKDDGESDAN
ncbi:MAG: type-F conjugative transfer system secretin TraK [Proteobacteria bacterium]|nr:type-F conjugative transfer system secretin TraK [Pseudomonadota bacterium]